MCDLVTTLNPGARHVFEFGALMLSWEVNQPKRSLELLDKAIAAEPDYWRYYYLRGFTRMFFLKDEAAARSDFLLASKLPDAHPIVARLLAKKMALSGNLEEALLFLGEMLSSSRNQFQQKALQERYQEVRYELDFQNLGKALKIYEQVTAEKPTALDDLVKRGIIRNLPRDPFGGAYYLDSNSGEIKSTSGHKRLGSGTVGKNKE